MFDSSIARGSPTTFAPNQVIRGWTEAMQLMREGDKWRVAQGDTHAHRLCTPSTYLISLSHNTHTLAPDS